MLRHIWDAFLSLLCPPTCLACEKVLLYGEEHLCTFCLALLPSAELEMKSKQMGLLRKFMGRVPLDHIFALYYFTKQGKIQYLLHQLKYHARPQALRALGRGLGTQLQQSELFSAEIILPVPLHAARERKRGYNQSLLLAEGVAEIVGLPVVKNALLRVHPTESQTQKGRLDRWKNVEGAFRLENKSVLQHKKVLLVDDLLTTGATLSACSRLLLQANVASIRFATLAVAYND